MTRFLAQDRAREIWGEGARLDGEPFRPVAYWTLSGAVHNESWTVLVGDNRHSFDQNGHTTCHEACARQEMERCV